MSSTQWQTMTDVETKTAARVLAIKKPPSAWDLWRADTYEKAQKEAQTKDIKVVAKKLGQYWKALKSADKAKFEADDTAVVKEMAPKWKQLTDKEKKPYVDKAILAKTDREAYLKFSDWP